MLGWMKWVVLVSIIGFYCLDFYLKINHAYMFDDTIPKGTVIDYLFYIFAGMKEYIPNDPESDSFVFPIKWVLLHLFILYCTLYYPSRDLSSLGLNILLRTKGRIAWWLSKSIWNICYVLAMYGLIFLTVILFCLLMNQPLSLQITPQFINDLSEAGSPFDSFSNKLVIVTLLLPLLLSIGWNLLQMTFALVIKPIYSFGVMAVMLLASAYYLTPFLPGNHAMPIRSIYVIENGLQIRDGIIASIILICLSLLIGSLYFCRMDILDEE